MEDHMNQPHPSSENDGAPVPEKLVSALRHLRHERVLVPSAVDAAVLAQARRRLAPPRPKIIRLADWWPWLATAAAACVALLVAVHLGGLWTGRLAAAREDLDGNGRVDILDAFALARRLERGMPLDPKFDLNHDGRVDQHDVETIVTHAVSLDKPHRS